MLESNSTISFRLAGGHGAALLTKYPTHREDVKLAGAFEKYAKEHYASWVTFAHETGHGDINPVLVTGVDRTKDFAMLCYSNDDDDLRCEFTTSVPGSNAWGSWHRTGLVYESDGGSSVTNVSFAPDIMAHRPSSVRHPSCFLPSHPFRLTRFKDLQAFCSPTQLNISTPATYNTNANISFTQEDDNAEDATNLGDVDRQGLQTLLDIDSLGSIRSEPRSPGMSGHLEKTSL